MSNRLEHVTKSQKLRIMMLFAFLAIVAAVAVFAFDDDIGEDQSQFGYDYYAEYVEGGGASEPSFGENEYEEYMPYNTNNDNDPSYIPTPAPGTPGEEPGDTPGQLPEPTPVVTPGLLPEPTPGLPPEDLPGESPDPGELPEETPPSGELPEETPVPTPGVDANEDANEGIEDEGYEEFEPAGGEIGFVPFGGGDTVTFITNTAPGAPIPVPGQGSRITAANGQVGNVNMPNPPVWPGHFFLQWNTLSNGTGTVFTGTTDVTGDMNVYAQWAFEVTFVGNGVTLPSTGAAVQTNPTWYGVRRIPLNTSVNANNAHVNPAFQAVWPDDPVVTGFTFLGWNSMPDGSGANLTGASNIGIETAAFAQWSLDLSTVTFNMQGGTLSAGTQSVINPGTPPPANITVNHSATRTVITGNPIEFSSHQTRGQFRQNTNVAWPRSAPEVVPPGPVGGTHQFLEGWWTTPNGWDGAGTRFAPPGGLNDWVSNWGSTPQGLATTNVTGDMTVHAHWVHRIFLQPNGGTIGARFTGGTPAVGTNIIQNQGAGFGQTQAYIDVPTGLAGAANTIGQSGRRHRTAPANMMDTFVPLTRLPGAPGTLQQQTVTNNAGNPSTGVYVGGEMTRAGHTFGGWWIANNGQNTTWAPAALGSPGHPVQLGHTPFDENTPISQITHAGSTVVAHWIPNLPVQVVFNPNGGTWTAAAVATSHVATTPTGNITRNVTEGAVFSNCSISGQTFPAFPTRSGYLFLGWHQVQDPGDGTTILGTNPITTTMSHAPPATINDTTLLQRFTPSTIVNAGQTVYARWLPTPYTITFMPNGGSNLPITRSVPAGWALSHIHSNTGWNDSWQGSSNTSYYAPAGWGGSSVWTQTVRSGWALLGFNTLANGTGTVFAHNTVVTGNIQVYAAWAGTLTFHTRHNAVYGILLNTTTSRSVVDGLTVGTSWQHANHPNAAGTASNNFPGLTVWAGAEYPAGAPASRTLHRPPGGTGEPIASQAFVGWNSAQDGTGDWWTEDTVMTNGTQNLYAIWRPWVNFRPGTGVPDSALAIPFATPLPYHWNRQFTVGFPVVTQPPDMTNAWPGHTWRGWFPTPCASVALGAARNFTLPVFFARTYYASFYAPVAFFPNGGAIFGNASTQVPVGHQLLQAMPDNLDRTGWTHIGTWNTNPNNTGDIYDQFTPIMSGRNLYATWTAMIEFYPGASTDGTPGVILLANEVRHVPEGRTLDENPPGQRMPPNPTHPDPAYDFAGWRIIETQGHPNVVGISPNYIYFNDAIRFNTSMNPNTANGNIKVEAVWVGSEVTITFDLAGGTDSLGSTGVYTMPRGGLISLWIDPIPGQTITNLTRPNYTFAGTWLQQIPAIIPPAPNIFTNAQVMAMNPETNMTFVAQWNPNPFTVTFELDGGSYSGFTPNTGPVTRTVNHNAAIGYINVPAARPAGPGNVPPATTFSRAGHTFSGWQEVIAGAPVAPTMSTGAVGLLTIDGANRTFRAIWTPIRHQITFVLSGGNIGGNINNVLRTVDDGQGVTHANTTPVTGVPVPVLLNRNLVGWLDSAGSQHTSAAVAGMTFTAPATFTAVWDYDPVLVTFHLAGGSYTTPGFPATGPIIRSLAAGEAITLGPIPIPIRTNYTFAGWGEVATPAGLNVHTRQEVADFVLVFGQPREFTAQWNPIRHPVTFVLSGGTYSGSSNNVVRTVNQGQNINHADTTVIPGVPVPTNPPQSFLHWLASDGTTVSSLFISVLPVTGPMTFTAVWDFELVPITFDLNGGLYGVLPGPIVDDFPAGLVIGLGRVPIPTRENYSFVTWREYDYPVAGTDTDRTRNEVASVVPVFGAPRTFVAQWARIWHPVTFQLAGGTYSGSTNNVVRSVRQGETILDPQTTITNTVPVPTNAPQIFQHWVRAGHLGEWSTASVAALTITGPETFTAVWDFQYVNVTFNLNNGVYSGNPGPIIHSVRAGIQIGSNYVPVPTRDNYTFVEWVEHDYPTSGIDTSRTRQQVMQIIPVYGEPRTFVAQWTPILHPVTFQLAGGVYNGDSSDVVRTVWQGRTVSDPTTTALNTVPVPTRYPMVFQYWRLSGEAGQWTHVSAAAFTISGPAIFTAVWDYRRVDVTFDLDGGIYNGNLGPITTAMRVGFPIGLNLVPLPTRANYSFVHWVEFDHPSLGVDTTRDRQQVSQVVPAYNQPRTFVAVWTPITHPVTFLLAGGTYGGNPADVVRIVNQSQIITHASTTVTPTVPDVARPFQTFVGWRNYDGVIWPATSVAALAVYGPRIFTAVWSVDLVSVTFDLAGGNVAGNSANIVLDLPSGLEIGLGNVPLPTRQNYTFVSWQEAGQPNRDHHQVAAQVLQIGSPRVFTALWEPIMHPVTFVMAGGTYLGSPNAIIRDVQHNGSLSFALIPTPVNPPQAFQGWHVANTAMVWDATSVAALTVTGPITFTAIWEHDNASVTFNLAGGDFAGNPGPIVLPVLPIGVAIGPGNVPVPTWEFRAFLYWAVMDGDTVVSTHSALQVAEWILTENIAFTAVWERVQFPVTFSFDGGTWNGNNNYFIRLYNNGAIIMPNDVPVPTRVNYQLVGWRRDDIGQPLQAGAIEGLQVSGPMTFVAVWVRITHPITFEMNGGEYEGSPADFVWIVSQATEIERVPDPTRANYVLTGWREYDYPAADEYTDRNQGQVAAIEVFGPRTFVAQWARLAHPVTFDLNGGIYNGSPANVVNMVNQNEQIGPDNIPTPTLTASTLTGWRMDGSGAVVSPGAISVMVVTEPMVFIAVWDALSHPVTFDLNGGAEGETAGPIVHNIVEGAMVGSGVIPMPTRTNYTLGGWQLGGQGATLSMTQVANIVVSNPMVFVAVWNPILHPVTFDLNGGSIGDSTARIINNVAHASAVGEDNVPVNPTLANSAFSGWRMEGTDIIHTPAQIAELIVNAPMTFIAQWDIEVIAVVFDLDGGNVEGNTEDIEASIVHGSAIGGSVVPLPVRTNYVLVGWRPEGSETVLSPLQVAATIVTTPLRFIAVWEDLSHPVTFNLYGGTYQDSSANVVRMVSHGGTVGADNVPAPTRGTSIFGGWREVGGDTNLTSAQVAALVITGPRIFIAQWDVVTHDVTFVLNGGAVNTSTDDIVRTVLDGGSVPLTDVPQPIRANYALSGWTEGSDEEVLSGLVISEREKNRSYTYTAVWVPVDVGGDGVEFTLIFDPTRGSLSAGIADRITGLSGFLVDNFPVPNAPAGYRFTGWTWNGGFIFPTLVVNQNMTLAATWAPVDYTVVYDPGPGVLPHDAQSTQQHAYGTQLTNHPVPSRTGYTFGGWQLNGVAIANPLVVVSDKILTAVWTPAPGASPTPTPEPDTSPTPTPEPDTSPTPTPTPDPGASPSPGPGASPSPGPGASPSPDPGASPSPGPASPSPTPAPTPGNQYTVLFNPYPGVHASNVEHGIRTGLLNSTINNIPVTPIRPGFIFGGWRLPNASIVFPGGQVVITGNKTLTAVWTPTGATPSPSPSPTPAPPGHRPNPQTNPIQISFMIFGAVMLAGAAATGIWTLASKQTAAAGEYNKAVTRYDREKRIVDMVKDEKSKK